MALISYLARYNKALVALAGVLAAVGNAVADGKVTTDEAGIIGGAVLVLAGVFGIGNAHAEGIDPVPTPDVAVEEDEEGAA